MSWSPDGRRLAWAGAGETVRIADAATGKTLMRLDGHTDTVASVQWSSDGKHIASASLDRTARIWDSVTGRPVATLTAQPAAGSDVQHDAAPWFGTSSKVAWSHDDRHLAWSGGGVVCVYEWQRGKEISRRPIGAWGGIQWSPTADLLIYGDDKTVHWWTPLDDTSKRIERNDGSIAGVDWSPDGAHVATIDNSEGTVHIFDVQTGEQTRQFAPGHEGAGRAVAWSPDGAHLAVVAPDRSLQIWDAGTGQTTSEHRARAHGAVSLQWSPDGSRLASGGGDGTVRVWMPGVPDAVLVLRGHTRSITTVRWSPDGTRLASTGNDRTIRIWDATRGYRWARTDPVARQYEHDSDSVRALGVDEDSRPRVGSTVTRTDR